MTVQAQGRLSWHARRWAATLGILLAVSRALHHGGGSVAFEPELALLEVVAHTHWLPRHWRGRVRTRARCRRSSSSCSSSRYAHPRLHWFRKYASRHAHVLQMWPSTV